MTRGGNFKYKILFFSRIYSVFLLDYQETFSLYYNCHLSLSTHLNIYIGLNNFQIYVFPFVVLVVLLPKNTYFCLFLPTYACGRKIPESINVSLIPLKYRKREQYHASTNIIMSRTAPFKTTPALFFFSSTSNPVIKRLKSSGLRLQPCLTPFLHGNASDADILTCGVAFKYIDCRTLHK